MLEHPPQLWNNSQISSSVATIYADNRQLVARTNNKLTGLYNSLSKQLFLVATWPKQPSLSASYLQERVSEGRGLKFCARASRAIGLAPSSFKSWTRHCMFHTRNIYKSVFYVDLSTQNKLKLTLEQHHFREINLSVENFGVQLKTSWYVQTVVFNSQTPGRSVTNRHRDRLL